MFAIGEFSRLAQVTVKTLRLYDELGLLPPARVDAQTGYRYYSSAQLPRLNRILVLKDLGFDLAAIGRLLERDLPVAELRGMLALRQEEQRAAVAAETLRLRRVELALAELERTPELMEILVKTGKAQWLASVRATIPNYQSVGQLCGQVFAALGAKAFKATPIAIWHDVEYRESDVDAEAGVLLDSPLEVPAPLLCRELPAVEVAAYLHRGSYQALPGAYQRLSRWIEASGWRIAGPAREVYLHVGYPVRQDDETYLTEIQFPVERTA